MAIAINEVPLPSRYAFALDARQPRTRSSVGVAVSLILHLLIGILLLLRIRADFARVLDAGSDATGPRGGGGGGAGRVAYITLPASKPPAPAVEMTPPRETPPPVPVTVTPDPPPTIPPPVPEEQPVAPATTVAATTDSIAGAGPGTGGRDGGGTGGGQGPGTGPGAGPGTGTGGGERGTGRASRPRFEILPPQDVPKEYRGREIRIVFSVGTDGRAERVVFQPPIPAGKFASRLKETMLNYRFHPALGPDGTPVPGSFIYTFTAF